MGDFQNPPPLMTTQVTLPSGFLTHRMVSAWADNEINSAIVNRVFTVSPLKNVVSGWY
jgi:hypothetical protein